MELTNIIKANISKYSKHMTTHATSRNNVIKASVNNVITAFLPELHERIEKNKVAAKMVNAAAEFLNALGSGKSGTNIKCLESAKQILTVALCPPRKIAEGVSSTSSASVAKVLDVDPRLIYKSLALREQLNDTLRKLERSKDYATHEEDNIDSDGDSNCSSIRLNLFHEEEEDEVDPNYYYSSDSGSESGAEDEVGEDVDDTISEAYSENTEDSEDEDEQEILRWMAEVREGFGTTILGTSGMIIPTMEQKIH
jgi:hypothetical protein